MKEFNLSEKIMNITGCISQMICEEDVKEFIKRLKEFDPTYTDLMETIDELAGEKLK